MSTVEYYAVTLNSELTIANTDEQEFYYGQVGPARCPTFLTKEAVSNLLNNPVFIENLKLGFIRIRKVTMTMSEPVEVVEVPPEPQPKKWRLP